MLSTRRRWLTRLAAVVLLLAVLPNALYVGHWAPLQRADASESAVSEHAHHKNEDASMAEAHARAGHCPAGPSKCTDAPGPAQPMVFQAASVLLVTAGLLLLIVDRTDRSRSNPLGPRIDKPPQYASSLAAA